MGAKLLELYEQAKQLGGLKAQMRMAMLTKVPSAKASELPDSQENIKVFEEAINEIKKENQ
jgi:hypothetical protein